jgi:excinuclease ABC subunit B
MYADTITPSMAKAIDETNRRRAKQVAYNTERGLDPQPLRKRIADIMDELRMAEDVADGAPASAVGRARGASRGRTPTPGGGAGTGPRGAGRHAKELAGMPRGDLALLIQQLTDQMLDAAAALQFEVAARLRDEINELKKELRGMEAAGV